jgi:AsmA-like protein
LQGIVDVAGGPPVLARLQRVVLSKDTDAHGDIRCPARVGAPWIVTASGRSLDASNAFNLKSAPGPNTAAAWNEPQWQVQAHFDQVALGRGRVVYGIDVRAVSDGSITRVQLSGHTSVDGGFGITLEKAPNGRRLAGTAQDVGALLRVLDVASDVDSGKMTLSGTYDDLRFDHPLSGAAELMGFRVRNVPAVPQLLQAMTLYSLVQLVQEGSGLAFDRLVAPYHLIGSRFELIDARAFSASLGVTAKGTLDLARERVDLQGTVVPAYFSSSLLGKIPLVGQLFSPKQAADCSLVSTRFAAVSTIRKCP